MCQADFPGGSDGKESACNPGDLSSIPGLERSPAEGNGYPFQYSGLQNSMDRGSGGLQSLGSQRVRPNWVSHYYMWDTLLIIHFIPIFWSGEFHGQRIWRSTVLGVTKTQTQLSESLLHVRHLTNNTFVIALNTMGAKYFCYPHFTNEVNEAQWR